MVILCRITEPYSTLTVAYSLHCYLILRALEEYSPNDSVKNGYENFRDKVNFHVMCEFCFSWSKLVPSHFLFTPIYDFLGISGNAVMSGSRKNYNTIRQRQLLQPNCVEFTELRYENYTKKSKNMLNQKPALYVHNRISSTTKNLLMICLTTVVCTITLFFLFLHFNFFCCVLFFTFSSFTVNIFF